MEWYKEEFLNMLEEYKKSTFLVLVFILILLIYRGISNNPYSWQEYNLISEPSLSIRLLSGLAFIGPGKVLYDLQFYRILYFIFVTILNNRGLYRDLKKIIWYGLMFAIGFIIIPGFIDILNQVVSFLINIVLYLNLIIPVLGVIGFTFLIIYSLKISFEKN
ncbi:MAG: hypothetical protein N4A38_03710 [Candidatus Gracilibacteria bacterium]|nr:hypothetical protein [Candidatus Gracilibacteria bacterium]